MVVGSGISRASKDKAMQEHSVRAHKRSGDDAKPSLPIPHAMRADSCDRCICPWSWIQALLSNCHIERREIVALELLVSIT